jgi:hypothetical protein
MEVGQGPVVGCSAEGKKKMQKEGRRKWRSRRRKPKITGESLVLHDLHKVSENISAGG